jgi:hypothetical protein
MRSSVRKIGLAAAVTFSVAGVALGMAAPAHAQHWHGHGGGYYGGGFGPGFVGGLAVGAAVGSPYYGYYGGPYAYAGDCYLQRRVSIAGVTASCVLCAFVANKKSPFLMQKTAPVGAFFMNRGCRVDD